MSLHQEMLVVKIQSLHTPKMCEIFDVSTPGKCLLELFNLSTLREKLMEILMFHHTTPEKKMREKLMSKEKFGGKKFSFVGKIFWIYFRSQRVDSASKKKRCNSPFFVELGVICLK